VRAGADDVRGGGLVAELVQRVEVQERKPKTLNLNPKGVCTLALPYRQARPIRVTMERV